MMGTFFKKWFLTCVTSSAYILAAYLGSVASVSEAQPVYVGSLLRYRDENSSGLPCWQGLVGSSPHSESIVPCSIVSPATAPLRVDTYVNTYTNEFNFTVLYPRDELGRFPEAISFLVSDGETVNQPERSGTHAIFYVDASVTNPGTGAIMPIINIFGFNAATADQKGPFLTSWLYGDRITSQAEADTVTAADDRADTILTNLNTIPSSMTGILSGSWTSGSMARRGVRINDYVVSDGSSINGREVREFTINIDASKLNNRTSVRYPDGEPWVGVSIGGGLNSNLTPDPKKIFIGLYAFNGINSTYESNIASSGFGYLNQLLSVGSNFGIYFVHHKTISETPIDCTGTPGGSSDCSVPTPTPTTTVQCTPKSWDNELFALDGGAAGLHELNKLLCKDLVRLGQYLGRYSSYYRRYVAVASRKCGSDEVEGYLKRSFDSFLTAWTASWSFPKTTLDCSNGGTFDAAFCKSNDYSSLVSTFATAANDVRVQTELILRLFRPIALSSKVFDILKQTTDLSDDEAARLVVRARAMASRYFRAGKIQANARVSENNIILGTLPTTNTVTCE